MKKGLAPFLVLASLFTVNIMLYSQSGANPRFFLLSNFDDQSPKDSLLGEWQIIADKLYCNGTSDGQMEFEKTMDAGKSGNALKVTYTLGKNWGSSPFLNLFCKYDQPRDFTTKYSGIRFRMKGNGHKLRLLFPSANITDWNFWGFVIDSVPEEWKEYSIPWSDLKPGWGTSKPLEESLRQVTEIQFHPESGAVGEQGWYMIDDVSLILRDGVVLEFEKPAGLSISIDVNQAFYSENGLKEAVVRCNEKFDGGQFQIVDSKGRSVLSGNLKYKGSYWNSHFWIIDFSRITESGEYRIIVKAVDVVSEAKVIVSSDAIQKAVEKTINYFSIQRCGVEVPGWHKTCHLDDAVLPDGRTLDATGGWHDCAGFDKEMYTTFLPVYFYTTIAFDTTLPWRQKMLDEARWGADWIMKMTDGSGRLWCHVDPHNVGPDEFIKTWSTGVDTDNVRGTPDDRKIATNAWGPEESCQSCCMGSLVKMGYLLKDTDKDYSRRCLDKAALIRNNILNRKYYRDGKLYGTGKSHYGLFHTGLLLADIYLYKLEKNEKYLADARERIDFIIDKCQTKDGEFITSDIEKVPQSGKSFDPYFNLICFYEFYKNFPGDPASVKIKQAYKLFMDNQVSSRVTQSPYGQAQLIDTDLVNWISQKTFQRNFEKPSNKISQGKNCYWLSFATVCFYANEIFATKQYTEFAVRQIDWVLGKNPFGCSTAAGIGVKFPRMFTMFYWLKNHPGSEGVIPGGLINGIGGDTRDFPYLDMGTTNWMAWETNEYWNPPTAWFAFACWQYYKLK